MTKLDFYNLFNEKMLEFARDLCNVFSNISEFTRFRSGVLMLQNLEPKTLENIFRTYVLSKYKDQILNQDESFFLDHTEFDIYSQRTDYWLSLIEQLKEMWKTLDQDNKAIVWKYFHVLIIISDKCHS
jgi:uncharacterized protein YheU (UPF0270 family)